MLKSLFIKDYALLEKVTVEFHKGFNIITGETGAGKSILIGALGLLLGERASSEYIRKGTDKSIVEGIFDISNNNTIKNMLRENDFDAPDELIIRRQVTLKGANRCFINDTPATLGNVKELGDLLVDLHGQHEHQSLLHSNTHIEFLDEFGELQSLLSDYEKEYDKLLLKEEELKSLIEREDLLKEKKEFYAYQLREIEKVDPQKNEDTELEEELTILENSERLLTLANSVYEILYESEVSVYDALSKVQDHVAELSTIDKSFGDTENDLTSAVALLEEVTAHFRSYRSGIDLDPGKLESIRDRLGELSIIKKKYGGTLENVLEHKYRISEELLLAEDFESKIEELHQQIDKQRHQCGELAKKLSEKRKKTAEHISKKVEEALANLGIENAVFRTGIQQKQADPRRDTFIIADGKQYVCNARGMDVVEFYISTNVGEDPKPLAKVASGGEISRIMLALKSILASSDKYPLLIFDEIDTGVSGRIAKKVGEKMRDISANHQLIAITHLPQIAGLAEHHYTVAKQEADGRVISTIRQLRDSERLQEVAKLISGEEVTEASLVGAKELMGISD